MRLARWLLVYLTLILADAAANRGGASQVFAVPAIVLEWGTSYTGGARLARTTDDQKRDRRSLLALMSAGGAAAVAALLSQRKGAEAHGTVHYDSPSSNPAVHGNNTSTGDGVYGSGNSGFGVHGSSGSGDGVYGFSSNKNGVLGISSAVLWLAVSARIGSHGIGDDIGVLGRSTKTGVKGQGSPGVYGISISGAGVRGDGAGAKSIGVFAKNNRHPPGPPHQGPGPDGHRPQENPGE